MAEFICVKFADFLPDLFIKKACRGPKVRRQARHLWPDIKGRLWKAKEKGPNFVWVHPAGQAEAWMLPISFAMKLALGTAMTMHVLVMPGWTMDRASRGEAIRASLEDEGRELEALHATEQRQMMTLLAKLPEGESLRYSMRLIAGELNSAMAIRIFEQEARLAMLHCKEPNHNLVPGLKLIAYQIGAMLPQLKNSPLLNWLAKNARVLLPKIVGLMSIKTCLRLGATCHFMHDMLLLSAAYPPRLVEHQLIVLTNCALQDRALHRALALVLDAMDDFVSELRQGRGKGLRLPVSDIQDLGTSNQAVLRSLDLGFLGLLRVVAAFERTLEGGGALSRLRPLTAAQLAVLSDLAYPVLRGCNVFLGLGVVCFKDVLQQLLRVVFKDPAMNPRVLVTYWPMLRAFLSDVLRAKDPAERLRLQLRCCRKLRRQAGHLGDACLGSPFMAYRLTRFRASLGKKGRHLDFVIRHIFDPVPHAAICLFIFLLAFLFRAMLIAVGPP